MRQSIWDKRIPTLLGILFLVGSVGITSLFVRQGTSLLSQASTSEQPLNVRMSNVSGTTATISFTTKKATIATVSYGPDQKIDQIATDVRDQTSSPTAHTTHTFTLNALVPNTPYFLTITAGGTTYKQPSGQPFQLITGSELTFTTQTDQAISGKILTSRGDIGKNVLVYISSNTAQELSSVTGIDGTFSFSLKNLRSKDLSQPLGIVETTQFSLLATDGESQSHVKFTSSKANPLAPITLGNDYDFSLSEIPMAQTSESSASARITFPSFDTQSAPGDPQILTPSKQGTKDLQPVFTGTGKPNETVEITIHSAETIQAKVITTKQGTWSYKPTVPLTPGNHTITIKTKDSKGISKTVTQSFIVYAADNKTPEPSISPSQFTDTSPLSQASSPQDPTPTLTILSSPNASSSPSYYLSLSITVILMIIIGVPLFFLARRKIFI
ncbi:hypothetical protein BH11PAT1_BH11PAT1_6430 [soil metagenome]